MNVDEETKESECITEIEDKTIENLSSEKCKTSTDPTDSVSNEYEISEECDVNQLTTKLNDSLISIENEEEIFWQTEEWKHKKKHVFILSSAGKPIYSRYGNEDDLVTLFGVMQAIVSFVLDTEDEIQSIHTSNTHFTFLRKGNILLVSVSQVPANTELSTSQLNYVYNQIVSILTVSQLTRIFDQYHNFDLRKLLSGSERLITNVIDFTENNPGFFLNSIECVPLSSSIRDSISQAIISCCQKIKNLLFAFLFAQNQLIVSVRMKKYNLVPADIHLILNLVSSSQSFRTAEGWTPICLPNLDPSGYLQAHVSYLSEDCEACLVLLTVDRELFFPLSEAKLKIVEKLQKANILQQISEALKNPRISPYDFGIRKLRHFIYKNKNSNQFVFPKYEIPYNFPEQQNMLLQLYCHLYQQMNAPHRPLKLIFQQLETEAVLGWDTKGFELYLVFEPFIMKQEAINTVNKLLKCMKKEEDRLFINSNPTF